mmetsp:Transcript_22326/g.68915  ORF Transcript_22326/g.68915 Transcript_22326/m.68915 type:complete len:152 (+) Transcript_22326:1246-1701(+)
MMRPVRPQQYSFGTAAAASFRGDRIRGDRSDAGAGAHAVSDWPLELLGEGSFVTSPEPPWSRIWIDHGVRELCGGERPAPGARSSAAGAKLACGAPLAGAGSRRMPGGRGQLPISEAMSAVAGGRQKAYWTVARPRRSSAVTIGRADVRQR